MHRELGPGLLESAYEEALAFELMGADLAFERQRETPLLYKGLKLNCGCRLYFLIQNDLVLELKAVGELLPIHSVQLLTYLRLERHSLGLLVNFNVSRFENGNRRIAWGNLFEEPT